MPKKRERKKALLSFPLCENLPNRASQIFACIARVLIYTLYAKDVYCINLSFGVFFVWGMIVGSLVFLCWAPHYYRGGETLVSKVSLSLCSICFVPEANFLGLEEGKSLGGNVGIV